MIVHGLVYQHYVTTSINGALTLGAFLWTATNLLICLLDNPETPQMYFGVVVIAPSYSFLRQYSQQLTCNWMAHNWIQLELDNQFLDTLPFSAFISIQWQFTLSSSSEAITGTDFAIVFTPSRGTRSTNVFPYVLASYQSSDLFPHHHMITFNMWR